MCFHISTFCSKSTGDRYLFLSLSKTLLMFVSKFGFALLCHFSPWGSPGSSNMWSHELLQVLALQLSLQQAVDDNLAVSDGLFFLCTPSAQSCSNWAQSACECQWWCSGMPAPLRKEQLPGWVPAQSCILAALAKTSMSHHLKTSNASVWDNAGHCRCQHFHVKTACSLCLMRL